MPNAINNFFENITNSCGVPYGATLAPSSLSSYNEAAMQSSGAAGSSPPPSLPSYPQNGWGAKW